MIKNGLYLFKKKSDCTEKIYTKSDFRKDLNKILKKKGSPEVTTEELEKYWSFMYKAYFQKYIMENFFETYVDINDVIDFWWKG